MNKGIKYTMVGVIAAGMAMSSYGLAIGVNWGTSANTFITLQDGTYLPTGDAYTLQIGTFSVAPTDGSSSLATFTAWDTETTGNTDGAFNFASGHDEGAFSHTQIYLVINDTTANERGIYYVNMTDNTRWKFAAGTDVPNDSSIDPQDLFSNPNGVDLTFNPGAHVVFGSPNADGSFNQLRLQTLIPEPSSFALLGVGLVGMLSLIRRRRS